LGGEWTDIEMVLRITRMQGYGYHLCNVGQHQILCFYLYRPKEQGKDFIPRPQEEIPWTVDMPILFMNPPILSTVVTSGLNKYSEVDVIWL
jgi:hypothetical protein